MLIKNKINDKNTSSSFGRGIFSACNFFLDKYTISDIIIYEIVYKGGLK